MIFDSIYSFSLIFLTLSLCLLTITSKNKFTQITCLFSIVCTLLTIFHLFANHFSKDGFNVAAIAHIKYLFDKTAILQFFWIGILTITTILVCTFLIIKLYRYTPKFSYTNEFSVILLILGLLFSGISVLTNPFTLDVKTLIAKYYLEKKDPLPNEFNSFEALSPRISYASPDTNKNFIIIFAESLELSFATKEWMPKLNALTKQYGRTISGITDLDMTNWTYSGIEATTCGLIYSIRSQQTKKSKKQKPLCIGNILHSAGFQLSFIGGSNFALKAKSELMETQQVNNIYAFSDIESFYQEKNLTLDSHKWGASDESLFTFTEHKLKQIKQEAKQQNHPYGLILLTLDTHTPGYPSSSCDHNANDEKTIILAVKCSDKIITDFIRGQLEDPSNANLDIFLISDHLYPGAIPSKERIIYSERELLFTHFNSQQQHSHLNSRRATNLDIAPTLLNILGFKTDSFNLGRNLTDPEQKTLRELMTYKTLNDNVVAIRKIIGQ